MKRTSLLVAVFVGGIVCGQGAAWADLAPPDACTSPGQPCQVAGPQYDQPGTCQMTTCTKSLPDGNGGVSTTTYACNLCISSNAGGNSGMAGASGSGAAGGGGRDPAGAGGLGGNGAGAVGGATGGAGGQTPGPGPKNAPSKSGCAVAGGGPAL